MVWTDEYMSLSKLPFNILGQVGPVLAWVERAESGPLPDTWTSIVRPFSERENSWLLRELPTYSVDNVEEIVIGTRFRHRRKAMRPAKLPFLEDRKRAVLDPPFDYDLLKAFQRLNRHFLIWNGTEPCIRAGLMEELHELALRVPAGHIVRHGHAQAVAEGVISFEDAMALPENITFLPSNAFGLRSVIRKGLSESHLHLGGVTSAEETWADSLLKPVSPNSIQGTSPEERRLLVLNLFAGRILAIAIWMSLLDSEAGTLVQPMRLLAILDRLYFARNPYEERWAAMELERAIREAIYGREAGPLLTEVSRQSREAQRERLRKIGDLQDQIVASRDSVHEAETHLDGKSSASRRAKELQEELDRLRWEEADETTDSRLKATLVTRQVPEEFQFLLRWISPTAWRIREMAQERGEGLPGNLPEGMDDRHQLVHRLHLAAHLRLIQLSNQEEPGKPDLRGPGDKHQDLRRHFLHRALFRYLVCRTHHWQMATQQGRTTGLRHFKRYFDSAQRKPKDITSLQKAEVVFDRLRHWRGLRVLEGRVSPPQSSQELTPWILAYARPDDRRIKKFGLVAHFKKEPEDKEDRVFNSKLPSPALRLRWGKRRRRVRDEGVRLYRLLRRPTPITPFVVGIDSCNLELATPPEVFAPVFRFLREYPISLMGDSRRFSPYASLDASIRELIKNRRLGMTYHVGEDFRHLLSGLRAICEVVDFLAPNPGDRLGHGTALALSPEQWLEHNGFQAVVPKLEWLDTLVWVHHFLGPGDDLVGELAIEDIIQRLSWEIYSPAVGARYDPLGLNPGKVWRGQERRQSRPAYPRGLLDWDWSPLTLWDAWRLRQLDPYVLDLSELLQGEIKLRRGWIYTEEERRWRTVQERVMRETRREIGSRNAYMMLALYWLDPGVRQRGNEITVIDMKPQRQQWLELCCRVEEKMKQQIHDRELVIEANPSANRIIGPMASYDQHHIFQLTLNDDQKLSRQVRVSINTDNPAVCNTTLAHEHYLVGEILIARGVPEAEVVKWLEWLRQNGEEYNFVRRLKTPEESPHMDRLLRWLQGIRKSVREARTRDTKRQAFWRWMQETHLKSQGFERERIAKEPQILERITSLTHRLGGVTAEGATMEASIRQLEELLKDLPADSKLGKLVKRVEELEKWTRAN